MAFGTLLLLWSLWEMSRWTPDIEPWELAATTFVQGAGMGTIFVPMNMIAFVTLPPALRTNATVMFVLIRNLGSAIGVSVTTTFLAVSMQTTHAQLAEYANPFNRNIAQNAPSMFWNLHFPSSLASLDFVIDRNAQIMAYSNDFLLMFFLSLPALLVVLLMRKPQPSPDSKKLHVME
jgi:DHA2 family multidrug resistance protein